MSYAALSPYEKLKSLPNANVFLKAQISFSLLDDIVYKISDDDATKQLNQEKSKRYKELGSKLPSFRVIPTDDS